MDFVAGSCKTRLCASEVAEYVLKAVSVDPAVTYTETVLRVGSESFVFRCVDMVNCAEHSDFLIGVAVAGVPCRSSYITIAEYRDKRLIKTRGDSYVFGRNDRLSDIILTAGLIASVSDIVEQIVAGVHDTRSVSAFDREVSVVFNLHGVALIAERAVFPDHADVVRFCGRSNVISVVILLAVESCVCRKLVGVTNDVKLESNSPVKRVVKHADAVRIAFSLAFPSLLLNPPGILPMA